MNTVLATVQLAADGAAIVSLILIGAAFLRSGTCLLLGSLLVALICALLGDAPWYLVAIYSVLAAFFAERTGRTLRKGGTR